MLFVITIADNECSITPMWPNGYLNIHTFFV